MNQEFFKPKKVSPRRIQRDTLIYICTVEGVGLNCLAVQVVLINDKKWGSVERDLLYHVSVSPSSILTYQQFDSNCVRDSAPCQKGMMCLLG